MLFFAVCRLRTNLSTERGLFSVPLTLPEIPVEIDHCGQAWKRYSHLEQSCQGEAQVILLLAVICFQVYQAVLAKELIAYSYDYIILTFLLFPVSQNGANAT
jgi:hypothetical protein